MTREKYLYHHAPAHNWLAKVVYVGGLCVGALSGPGAVLDVGSGPGGDDGGPDASPDGAGADASPDGAGADASPDGVGPDASPDDAGAGADVGPEVSPDSAGVGPDEGPDASPDCAGTGPDTRLDTAGPGSDSAGPNGVGPGPDGVGSGPDVSIGPNASPDDAGPGPGLVGSVVAPEGPVVEVCAAALGMGAGVEDDDGGAAGPVVADAGAVVADAGSLPEVSIGAGPVFVLSTTTFGNSLSLMGICRPRDAP
jgi:hypothetical protein